jgi:hypothetical protein
MRLKSFTVEEVMEFGPCMSRAEVEALFAGRDKMTARDALSLNIPPQDIIWTFTRPGVLPVTLLRRWLADVVERALLREREAGQEPDPRSWAVIKPLRHGRIPSKKQKDDAYAAYAVYASTAAHTAAAYASAAYASVAHVAARAEATSAYAEKKWQVKRLAEMLGKS